MKRYQKILVLINLILVLGLFTNSVIQKEALLADGKLVLLELVPADPRSLIQGDYMRLRYAISDDINYDSITKQGYCVVEPNPNGTLKDFRMESAKVPLGSNEYLIGYTKKSWNNINIGAESYFFQEGEAEKYENAKYGGIRVDKDGNSLLVGLYDEDLNLIE